MRPIPEPCPAYDLPVDADPIDLVPLLDLGGPPHGGSDGDLGLRSLLEWPEVHSSCAAWWRDERAHRPKRRPARRSARTARRAD